MGEIRKENLHESLVNEIEELSQNASNMNEQFLTTAKECISYAIGEPLNAEDSFSKMGDDINKLLYEFKINLLKEGVTVDANDKFNDLITKLSGIRDSITIGQHYQFVEGTIGNIGSSTSWTSKTINYEFRFTPVMVIVLMKKYINNDLGTSNVAVISTSSYSSSTAAKMTMMIDGRYISAYIDNITENGFNINVMSPYSLTMNDVVWYAIGQDEDRSLRDSLASILSREGVEVLEEDDLATLIVKVDEEFARRS